MPGLGFTDNNPSPSFWRSLFFFNVYRLIIGGFFLASATGEQGYFHLDFGVQNTALFRQMSELYLFACVASLAVLWRTRRYFNAQLGSQVLVDLLIFLVLMQASGGGGSGIGLLLLVSLASAALVGEGRLVLFYAALATIGVLLLQVFHSLATEFDPSAFMRVGVLSLAFFATALLARMLAKRVVESEELARRRGEDLKRQLRLTTRMIAMLEDGVLVVSAEGKIIQANPKARALLSLSSEEWGGLARLDKDLSRDFQSWRRLSVPDRVDFAPQQRPDLLLNAHFVDVPNAGGDALVFLQDVGESREHERRMKLAALGRLTAGIAHEIRNPLSSIRHATELLREDCADPAARRMHDIVLDNAERLEHIVRDVLELGKRDRAVFQVLQMDSYLAGFLSEFLGTLKWSDHRIAVEMERPVSLRFDPSHLHQVLWNLLANAGRYASERDGSIRILVEDQPIRLTVEDDGPGVPEHDLSKLFEPFHTTSKKGNGLGLYIARELCEANGFRLAYARRQSGACFIISAGG
jgi:two-component system, NtrC family, sensor histidine kinase PilS